MAKKKTVKKAVKPAVPRVLSPKQQAVRDATQINWLLKGKLKNGQIQYLQIGRLLAEMRDKGLYTALNHPDVESYAEQRLGLGRSSLYKYLNIYDWAAKSHPEWLQPKPQGFIPDLSDASDLIWIESQLSRKDVGAARRLELEALRKKALAGTLKQAELIKFRSRTNRDVKESVKGFLSKLRAIRRRGAELDNIPAEVMSHIDAAINILKNDNFLKLAGIDNIGQYAASNRGIC